MLSTPARRRSAVVLALALPLTLASACGGSDDAPSASGTGGGASSADFEAFAVDHAYGTTEITEQPERVVSLDDQWTDVLLALDHPPVGYLANPGAPDGLPWREGLLTDATELTGASELPYEQIAALDPDLIVITYNAPSQEDYELLSGIAPTIATLGDGAVDPWQDIAEVAGRLHGVEDEVAALVDGIDAEVAAVRSELPGLEGASFAFANYVPGDAVYVLTDAEDGANVAFTQLGLVIPESLTALATGSGGRAKISFEELSRLDTELLAVLANGADPASIPGFDRLPAVQAGAVTVMDYVTAVALNTPSPLSVPYGLEALRPALERVGA